MPPARERLIAAPIKPSCDPAERAHLVLLHAHEACAALLKAFDASRTARRASGGNTTNAEQDLLRAMLVFAGAGFDATCKRLIEDSLSDLVAKSPTARSALESFAARRLRDEATRGAESAKGQSLLAAAITSPSPQAAVVQAYVSDLLAGSLQSVDRLFEALAALGLQGAIPVDKSVLKGAFDNRNAIIHEMDMDFEDPHRRRKSRTKDSMVKATNALLSLADSIIHAVDKVLA